MHTDPAPLNMLPSELHQAISQRFTEAVPHVRACGMVLECLDSRHARVRLPYRDAWLGDRERGLIHTGILTTVVDTVSGLSVYLAIKRFGRIATLDLRMDYLRPAQAGMELIARAECYRLTPSIAFVSASIWQQHEDQPCAVSRSSFMRAFSRSAAGARAA
jgi:uncharacterized protein (TIGR00369 family)